MNSIAKISVALFAGLVAVVPAAAGDNAGVVSAALEPQYWVMAMSAIALVGLGLGSGKADAAARTSADAARYPNAALA